MSGRKRTLQLLRHAKSSWSGDAQNDRDRRLTARGRAAAGSVGAHLAAADAAPELILCSPARRTLETCERMCAAFARTPPRRDDARLYHASAGRILEILRALDAAAPARAMVVGHNPGLQALAAALAARAAPAAAERALRRFPTAALAEFEFESAGWGGLEASAVVAARFRAPDGNPL